MLQVPAGHYEVDPSILPRGMSSYIRSLMKQSVEWQKIGAYVNGTALTCIFEQGELICVTENKCFMKKVLAPHDECVVDMQTEIDAVKHKLNDDLLASVFTDPVMDPESAVVLADAVESTSDDYGNWLKGEPELRIEEIKISFVGPAGQMDSTKSTVLQDLDKEICLGNCDLTTSSLWDHSIPEKDRTNLYKFFRTLNHGVEIHLIARNRPIMKLAASNEQTWDDFGNEGSRLDVAAVPPQYRGRFPGLELVPTDGPVRWLMISFYYLLYWVFKMIETNLGREFDGELREHDERSSFLLTPSWQ
jgi:hypothetical protein